MTVRSFVVLAVLVSSPPLAFARQDPIISVREADGGYTVSARFNVPEPADVVRAVLTDYNGIPRFMPNVRASRVVERRDASVRVEQEAVSRYLLFSKRVHLLLEVNEGDEVIEFRDLCSKSFTRYQGVWVIAAGNADTELRYELTAQPAFGVPGFVLRKLLDRDAREMIDALRMEISTRALAR
jgi:ribosome-associated toxin RatA of RatAB toxin-antitoxin module